MSKAGKIKLVAVGQTVLQSVEDKGYGGKEQSLPSSSRRSRKSK
ncbi:hypothetical protein WEU38_06115 [Cyanobacterium aponinum AL20118]|uniref:Uncharacterized protein n=1 Tax=Cyanobacterium aponinum AL20115 TaxID=3090662 RepID=A0AAF1C6B3_9CHRO|nr:hypothetical protein [Cyanobacterium aponinum]WPF89845.1 hypothetical protein SAY89_06135 [Cyanobacterium aponinum AL20115]WRL37864.1 hypothetical protein VKI22_14750 [Cyanobacterium aponinum UTEX 3221]